MRKLIVILVATEVGRAAFGQTFQLLHSFEGVDGSYVAAGLLQGADGNFYGTTSSGGLSDAGTVFRVTPAGVVTTLVSFNHTNGSQPYTGLAQGKDGSLYGTTTSGGRTDLNGGYGYGTLFRVTTNGVLTTLAFFDGTNGLEPLGRLIQGSDGAFFGTTEGGGVYGYGTVFRVATNGVLTTLISFSGLDGAYPDAGLIEASDRSFYGTTIDGNGTVFKVTTNGILTTLAVFDGPPQDGGQFGAGPSGLIFAEDGNFYGSTDGGGGGIDGTVFRMSPQGILTRVVDLHANAEGGVVQTRNHSLYGTTAMGGSGHGTVFTTTTNGAFTTFFSFEGTNGTAPFSDLVQGDDGNLYGTTFGGGANGFGTVFRILLPILPEPVVLCNSPGQCGAVSTYSTGADITCIPPSGSFFPVGTNTVTCTTTNPMGVGSPPYTFTVTVKDCEPPIVACQPIHKLPAKRKAERDKDFEHEREREEDLTDCFQLSGHDNCDPNPRLFIQDSATGFLAGPFASGDILKITKKDGRQEADEAKVPNNPRSAIAARLRLKGNGLLHAVDASGNVGSSVLCKAVAKGLR